MKYKTLLITALSALLLIGCGNKKAQKQAFNPILPVEISVISQTDDNSLRNYVGTTKSEMELPLSFPLGGKLTGIYVKNGQHVKKGTVIARVDATSAKSIHDAALATLNQAEDGYNRLKQVHDEGGIPDVRWVQMETDLEKARQTEITARKHLNECTLIAPQEGFISMDKHTTGENMLPTTPFCRIIDMNKMIVEFSVPEKEIGIIQIGDKAEASFPGLNNLSKTLEIIDKSFVSNPMGHTYTIKAKVPVENKDILPGMVAKIKLSLSEASGIVVPSSCVLTMPEGADVWTVKNGKAYRRNIKVGGFVKNGVVVESGLESGDTIITVGYQKLYNGAKVSF
ncbi:MAG: efflux RND transporter periplasmic adaptor subunit [Bacteroidales bacterium]|nr:efflux RND transporter periplasmic adaptor subunit [Bacteroidales bacterium]